MKSEVTWKLSTIFAIRNRLNNLLYVTKHVNSSSKSIKATLFAQISHFRRICPIVASLPPGILPHPATGIFIETTGSNLNHSSSLVSKKKTPLRECSPFPAISCPPKISTRSPVGSGPLIFYYLLATRRYFQRFPT